MSNRIHQLRAWNRNKFNARKVRCQGYTFDSRREYEVFLGLKMLADKGEINGLQVHPIYRLHAHGPDGVKRKICKAILDFKYFDTRDKDWHVVDVKGFDNDLSKLKRKFVEAEYGITVEIVR